MNFEEVDRALNACYDSIAMPENWADALNSLARSVNAAASMFYPKDVNADAANMPASPDYQEFLVHYAKDRWYEGHYRAERGWPLIERTRAAVILEHDLATDEERRHLPHYNDLYLRWGYKGFAAVGFKVEGKLWCVPFLRSVSQGFFTRDEAPKLVHLADHFSRMVRLSHRFAHARGMTGVETLDRLDRAALLLDHGGRVLELNAKAEHLLERSAASLFIQRSFLRAAHCDSDKRLQALVSACTSAQTMRAPVKHPEPILIRRLIGRPFVIEAVSLPELISPIFSRAHGLLLITDLDEPPCNRGARWATVFGLTPAEMRLCEALMSGLSLNEAAEELQITIGTARQRLKTVLNKTDTHRQGELILLLSKT